MFSKEDFENYFKEIEVLEQKMLDECTSLLEKVSDPKIRKGISAILEDEKRHVKMVSSLNQFI